MRDIAVPELGLLVFRGPGTRLFLQGQLSCDIERLAVGHWAWGGYLTPKGRLLATFLAVAMSADAIGLVTDRGLFPVLEKRFRTYLLRAKTELAVDPAPWVARLADPSAPQAGTANRDGERLLLGLGEGMVLASGVAGQDVGHAAWLLACARRGYPWLAQPLQEELTAHMASLDLLGGIDFDKGCYVGQEMVIRAHHRGAIKKRAFLLAGTAAVPVPGTAISAEVHGGQVAGVVLYAAPVEDGFIGLGSLRKDAVAGLLQLPDGTAVTATAPPYGLFDPEFESG